MADPTPDTPPTPDPANPPPDATVPGAADPAPSTELMSIQPASMAVIAAPPSDPLLSSVLEYGPPLMAAIDAAESGTEPDAQVAAWGEALRIGRGLRGALAAQGLDQTTFENLLGSVGSDQARWLEVVILYAVNADSAIVGRMAIAEAQAANARGYFASAATSFETASELMKPHVGAPWIPSAGFIRAWGRAMAPMMRGYDRARLQALSEATQAFQLSQARVKNELVPLLNKMEQDGEDVTRVRQQLSQFEVGAIITMLTEELRSERFALARVQAAALVQIAESLGQQVAPSQPDDEFRKQLAGRETIMAMGKASGEFATAELARQNRQWADAEAGYASALQVMKQAGQALAELEDLPIARDAQTMLLNTTMIEAARRRLEENRSLVEEGERRVEAVVREAAAWREAIGALQRFSPSINFQNVNQLSASMSLAVEVTQVAQQQLAADLTDLGHAIAAAPHDAERARLLAEIEALKAAAKTEKPESFFKKAGEFAESAAKLLKGVEEAAGPLGKVVMWVAPFAPQAMKLLGLG